MTRAELDQSNAQNILGPGKVRKNRHSTHNTNMANYTDQEVAKAKPFTVSSNGTAVLKSPLFIGVEIAKFEREVSGSTFYEGVHFTKVSSADTVTMIPPYTLNANSSYLITLA